VSKVAALIGGSELGLALYLQTIPKAMSDDLRSAFDDAAHYTAEVQRIFELVAFMFLRMRGKDAVIKLYSVGKRSSEQAAALRVKLSALVSNMASKKKAADQAATASKPVPTAPTRAPALPSASAPALPFAQLAWTPPHQAAPPAPPFIFGQPQELQLPQWETFEEDAGLRDGAGEDDEPRDDGGGAGACEEHEPRRGCRRPGVAGRSGYGRRVFRGFHVRRAIGFQTDFRRG